MSVIPSTVDSVYELASALLLVAEDALGTTIGGTPERSYVAPAEPPWDCCPFLAVFVPAIAEGTTAAGGGGLALGHRATAGAVNLIGFQILAIRCAPEFSFEGLPTPAQIESVARQVQQDGWALWNGLRHAIREDLFASLCSEVYLDLGSMVNEQGTCVGWRFSVRVALGGIPLEES